MSDSYAGIVEQWVRRVVEEYGARLAARGADDPSRRKSNAFCGLCVAAVLGLDEPKAMDCLTDGGEDGGVDAIYLGETINDSFTVWVFQAKYHASLEGRKAFPSGELPKIIQTVQTIFDPDKPLTGMRDIAHAVEDARSRIRDGAIPQVQVVLCSNGVRWQADGDARIAQAGLDARQVQWDFVNHRRLVELKVPREINTVLAFEGDAAVEDLSFRRVFVGRLGVRQLAALMDEHGDLLLERNIRHFLGPNNRVNHDMMTTLATPALRPNFYFYNNGVTMVCRGFQHNSLQARNFGVQVKGLQIINGGQTCKTIQRALQERPDDDFSQAHVLVRLYALDADDQDIIDEITYATNSQTPIELQDLRANDEVQRRLVLAIEALGYTYEPKRGGNHRAKGTIGSAEAAEAVMAVWRQKPHVARAAGMKLFDQYYAEIFSKDLTGAEMIAAVLVLRDVEGRRRERAYPAWAELFMRYASHHLTLMICKEMFAGRPRGWHMDAEDLTRALEHWRPRAGEVHAAMVEALAVVLRVWGHISFAGPQVLRDISAAFRGGRLNEGLALWFEPNGTARRDAWRDLAKPDLDEWKQRHAGRGHQLDLSGPQDDGE